MKKYIFEFTEAGRVSFLGMPKKIRQRIEQKLLFFLKSPAPLSYAKPLTGYAGYWRFRVGDYRVIVTAKERQTLVILLILKVGHRKDVYE